MNNVVNITGIDYPDFSDYIENLELAANCESPLKQEAFALVLKHVYLDGQMDATKQFDNRRHSDEQQK